VNQTWLGGQSCTRRPRGLTGRKWFQATYSMSLPRDSLSIATKKFGHYPLVSQSQVFVSKRLHVSSQKGWVFSAFKTVKSWVPTYD
jgi:hypothetical protein